MKEKYGLRNGLKGLGEYAEMNFSFTNRIRSMQYSPSTGLKPYSAFSISTFKCIDRICLIQVLYTDLICPLQSVYSIKQAVFALYWPNTSSHRSYLPLTVRLLHYFFTLLINRLENRFPRVPFKSVRKSLFFV